jgi:hypothetical protein
LETLSAAILRLLQKSILSFVKKKKECEGGFLNYQGPF